MRMSGAHQPPRAPTDPGFSAFLAATSKVELPEFYLLPDGAILAVDARAVKRTDGLVAAANRGIKSRRGRR